MPKPQQNRVNIADSRSWKYHISKAAFGRRDIVRSAIPTKLPIPFTPLLSVRFIGLCWWYAGIAQNVYFALQFCYTGIGSHTGSRKVVVKLSEILSALFNPPYRPSH